jgi:hypothetical protein
MKHTNAIASMPINTFRIFSKFIGKHGGNFDEPSLLEVVAIFDIIDEIFQRNSNIDIDEHDVLGMCLGYIQIETTETGRNCVITTSNNDIRYGFRFETDEFEKELRERFTHKQFLAFAKDALKDLGANK